MGIIQTNTTDRNSDTEKPEVYLQHQIVNNQRPKYLLRTTAVMCVMLLSFGSHYSAHIFGALKSQIKSSLEISNEKFGILQSTVQVPNTIIPILAGIFIDLFGNFCGAFAATSLVVIGSILIAVSAHLRSFYLMVFGNFVYGLGSGTIVLIQETIFAKWFKKTEIGLWLGILFSAGKLGGAMSNILSPQIDAAFNFYGYALWISALLCALSWISCILYIAVSIKLDKNQPLLNTVSAAKEKQRFSTSELKHLPSIFWLFVLCPYLLSGGWIAFDKTSKNLFEVKYNKSSGVAGSYSAIILILASVLNPLVGNLVDRLGRRPFFLLFSSLLFTSAVSIIAFTHLNPIISVVVYALSLGVGPVAMASCIPLIVSQNFLGTAFGLYTSSINTGGIIQNIIAGKLQDRVNSYSMSLIFFVCIGFLASFSIIFLIITDRLYFKKLTYKPRTEPLTQEPSYKHLTPKRSNYLGFAVMTLILISSWVLYFLGLKK